MIYYLVTTKHQYTMRAFIDGVGKALAPRVRIVTYRDFMRSRRLPFGTYIFSDVDRLSGSQSSELVPYWNAIREAGAPVFNHPTQSMRRYDLLRKLNEEGINRFDAYMMTEHRKPKQFPVFVRAAYDHLGAISDLLPDQAALDAELARLRDAAIWPGDKLIVEFLPYADSDGVYRKYAAFRIGKGFVPRQMFAGRNWVVKIHELNTPDLAAEEAAFLDADPHRDELIRIFEIANIDYGRIDYTIVDGQVQVFEINCNPTIIGPVSGAALQSDESPRGPTYRKAIGRYIEAMEAIDVPAEGRHIDFPERAGAN